MNLSIFTEMYNHTEGSESHVLSLGLYMDVLYMDTSATSDPAPS